MVSNEGTGQLKPNEQARLINVDGDRLRVDLAPLEDGLHRQQTRDKVLGDDGGNPVEEARPRFKEGLRVPELILNDLRLVEVVLEPPIGLEQE